MRKEFAFLLVLLIVCLVPVYGQVFGEVGRDAVDAVDVDYERGFTAQVGLVSRLFEVTDVRFSDAEERDRRTDHLLINNFPLGSLFNDGTHARFGFNADWFGGAFSLAPDFDDGGSVMMWDVRAWVSFLDDRLRVSAGNDIGYSFANTQGGNLRVFDDHVRNVGEGEAENPQVDTYKSPDNITGGDGILIEIMLDPITIALAAGGGFLRDMGRVLMTSSGVWTQEAVFGHSLRYGVNVGGRIGDIARVNVAYIFESERDETQFTFNHALGEIVAIRPDAHIITHQFGLFGSVYPFQNEVLGITVGYAGVLVRYLDEFSVDSETIMPTVLKHGINLAAQYQMGNLTVRMDHNYSFWADRNYRIFNLHRPHVSLADHGLASRGTIADSFADVNHSFLWNRLGVSYRFTDVFEGSVTLRNLLRIDETPQFRMLNNYFLVELRSNFTLGSSVDVFVGLDFDYTVRTTSAELSDRVGEFPPAFDARDTRDTRLRVGIPIGLTVRLQRDLPGNGE